MKDKNHVIISLDAEKAFDKLQHPCIINFLVRLETKGTFLYIIKAVYKKPTANINLDGEKLKTILLKSGTRQGYPLSAFLSGQKRIRQEREIKGTQIRNGV